MLLALCLTFSPAALAESADAGIIDPFAADQPGFGEPAAAQSYREPEGTEVFLQESAAVPERGSFFINEVLVGDTATARDAAENSVTIPAKPGCKVLDVRVLYHPYDFAQTMADAFAAKVICGDEELLPFRVMLESTENGMLGGGYCYGLTTGMCEFVVNGGNESVGDPRTFGFLVNVQDRTETFELNLGRFATELTYSKTFFMYNVIVQAPETVLNGSQPVFIQLTVGERSFWCQIL